MAYLTPAELLNYIDIDISGMPASTVAILLERAQEIVDAWLGGTLEVTEYVEDVNAITDDCCNLTLYLGHRPIITVDDITLTAMDNSQSSIDPTVARIRNEQGIIEVADAPRVLLSTSLCLADVCKPCSHVRATVTYEAGIDPVPNDVKKATALLFQQITLTGSPSGAPTIPGGQITSFKTRNYSETYSDMGAGTVNEPSSLLNDVVKTLLRKYKQPDGETAIGIVGA